ncbi:MAG TPA: RNA polymerase sigma factor [Bacteroidales bacterium]|nr:RNA polymerase sigma factor [Bacteroidales bacterium]
MTDESIINKILQGDRDIYRELVEKYQPMVFRACMGFIHQKEEAEDLTQEVFIQAYQALPSFKGNASFSTWIYRIAINASLNKVRKTSKSSLLQRFESFLGGEKSKTFEFPIPENENPETILIMDEHRAWVQKALDSLPENQRTAIILSKYDDLSQKEIAAIMNTTEGAVEALIQRAKTNLRDTFSSLSKKVKK